MAGADVTNLQVASSWSRKEMYLHSSAGCQGEGETKGSHRSEKEKSLRSEGLNGLHAGCQLTFRLSVTICWGASRTL